MDIKGVAKPFILKENSNIVLNKEQKSVVNEVIKYKDKFKQLALPYYKRVIMEYERMQTIGEGLSSLDKEIFDSLKNEFDYHEIKLDMMKMELLEKQNRIEGLMMLQQASNQELIWANVFHDTIHSPSLCFVRISV